MKYKTVDIPRPEWCQIGTVVKSKRFQGTDVIAGITHFGWVILDNNQIMYKPEDLEPVPAWEPTPGEYCAFWDEGYSFIVDKYSHAKKGSYFTIHGLAWNHVARIYGVDCACSLQELMKRTDYL